MTPERFADEPASDIRVVSETLRLRGHVWDVRTDRFVFGDETLERDYMDHPGAVAVLALDEDGRVLLLKQYRHPVAHYCWELPAGLMDVPGESALECAKRELAEEADLSAKRWDLLLDICNSPGGSSEAVRVFLARDLAVVSTGYQRTGEEADLEPRWVSLDGAAAAVLEGRVQNAIATGGILAAVAARHSDWRHLRPADEPWMRRSLVRGERSE